MENKKFNIEFYNFVRFCTAVADLGITNEQAETAKKILTTFPTHSVFWGEESGERYNEWENGTNHNIRITFY